MYMYLYVHTHVVGISNFLAYRINKTVESVFKMCTCHRNECHTCSVETAPCSPEVTLPRTIYGVLIASKTTESSADTQASQHS